MKVRLISTCIFCWVSCALSAQTITASITGTVTDPNGGYVPNVRVVATNQATNIPYPAQTNAAGVYTIPFLPIGSYVLTLEATGFKKLVSNPIQLEVNQIARVDLKLELGPVAQEVTVSDVATVLQTESTTVGSVVTGNTATHLPLNGRNFQQLTLLVPGAITPNPGAFTGAGQGSQGRPFVNGNREQTNQFLVDGISVDETIDNRIGYKPSVDAIAEFRIETSNSSSEFGNVAGATVITSLKSGTNAFHGNAFEFLRNDKLDANSWSNNRSGAPKSSLRRNVFGATLGGPIRQDRVFFFTDYQGTKERTGGGATRSVAPAEWRTGDLSAITAAIRDPLTGQPFTGNRIPAARIVNPAARALFADTKLYPLPNRTVSLANPVNNYVTSFKNAIDGHQFDVKIDARLSERDNFSSRYYFGDYETKTPQTALPTDVPGATFSRPQGIVANWVRSFTPAVINEARVGMSRAVFISSVFDANNLGAGNAKLGIPGGQAINGLSNIRLAAPLSGIGATAVIEDNVTNTFHYGDNLTLLRGRHTLKMGGQWQRYQQNRFYPGNNGLLGYFTYAATFTGNGFADFLLDQVSQKGVGNVGGSNPGTWGHRQNRIGVFLQDDFKFRRNLTVNLGLRWEYTSPVVEVQDRQANFDIQTGARSFAGQSGASRALYRPFRKGFEPRIGFAWTPWGKLVVRAGYGITQYMEGTGSNLRLPLNPPFFSEVDQPFDASTGPGSITRGFTDVIARNQVAGLLRVWNPDLRPQFTQQWNVTLEYQITNTASVSAAYVAHAATHLVAPTDWNQARPDPGAPSTWRPLQQRRPLYSVWPLATAISGTDSPANSNYNALQMSGRQRLAKGLEFLMTYTWSKTITDNIGYYGSGGTAGAVFYQGNAYNRRGDRGRAIFDSSHVFNFSGVYDLPFGKGRKWGNDWHPVANAIFGGWGVASIVHAHSGFPMTIRATDVSLQAPRGGGRPNRLGRGPSSNQNARAAGVPGSSASWLDYSAFTLPPQGSFGNSGIGVVEAPGFFNWDFSVGKKFYVRSEARYLDFRAEFFNILNTPSFSPPDVTWTPTAQATFGKINGTISAPRIIEFALKFHF
jgi:hypothetical protein